MTERPILFKGPMVRAILAGTKTQPPEMMALFRGKNYHQPTSMTIDKPFEKK